MAKSQEFIDEVDKAIKKVIDLNINRGHAQYQGRGMIGGMNDKDMKLYWKFQKRFGPLADVPVKIPDLFPYKNRWDMINGNKRDVVMNEMDKVVKAAECYGFDCEGGLLDRDVVKKHLGKLKDHIMSRVKDHLANKALENEKMKSKVSDELVKAAESSSEEEKIAKEDHPDMSGEEGGKLSKTGRKKRKDAGVKRKITAGQQEWLDYVDKVAKMKKYKDLPRKDIVKIASMMRKGGIMVQ